MKHTICASNSITSLSEYIFRQMYKENKETSTMQAVIAQAPNELSELLEMMLEVVITEDSNFMWSLSKPLLGMIIINENQFNDLKNYAISRATSNSEAQAQVSSLLDNFMVGVARSLDSKNRDYFGKKFTELRQSLTSLNT